MHERTGKHVTGDGTMMLTRVYSGIAVVLLGAVLLGWVTTVGDVKVNASAISTACARLDRHDQLAERRAADVSDIKADLSAIKVMLERIEKELEDR